MRNERPWNGKFGNEKRAVETAAKGKMRGKLAWRLAICFYLFYYYEFF